MIALVNSTQITGLSEIITPETLGSKRRIHTVLLIALFAVEAMIFYVHVARDIAPFYPSNFDQLSYYLATYDLISAFHVRGPSVFVEELLQPTSATGSTFVLQGALLSLIGGQNRTAILSINLVYLLALQVVFFVVIRTRTGRTDLAWIGMAFLLSLSTLFNGAGGIYDYRLAFSVFCLYCIWSSLLVWSRSFLRTSRALLVVAIGILLVYSRFFTIIYVGGVLGTLLASNTYAIWRKTSPFRTAAATRRIRNILLSGTIIAAICGARLFLSRAAIYNYYVVGHVLGEEKFIRAHELGLYTIWDHLLYYPISILNLHIGRRAIVMVAILLACSIVAAWRSGRALLPLNRLTNFRLDFILLGLAILIPVVTLTANISKSAVVGGIVVVPVVLAVVFFCAALWPKHGQVFGIVLVCKKTWPQSETQLPIAELPVLWSKLLARGTWPMAISVVMIVVGIDTFVVRGLMSQQVLSRLDLQRISELSIAIARYAADSKLVRPTLSTDSVVDYINVGTPKLFSIEKFHRNLDFIPRFGHSTYGIFATSREDALRLFSDSDIIVLTDPVKGRLAPYPMNTKITEYWQELWQWTNQNRVLLFSTEILGIPYQVFVGS